MSATISSSQIRPPPPRLNDRPRPKFTHAATVNPTMTAVSLETGILQSRRPANHLQQYHLAHSKSYDSSMHMGVVQPPPPSLGRQHSTEPAGTGLQARYDATLSDSKKNNAIIQEPMNVRPPLVSKFSFDNLATMGASEQDSSFALKKLATRAWLQNIANAARNSTLSPTQAPSSSSTGQSYSLTPCTSRDSSTSAAASAIPKPSSSRPRFRPEKTNTNGNSHSRSSSAEAVSQTTSSISKGHMIISNPELVHPAMPGSVIPNNQLGYGARLVGNAADAFGHHVYVAPSSPPPRRSEDSVRSLDSSTSTSVSLTSGCTASSFASVSSSAAYSTLSTPHAASFNHNANVTNINSTRQDRALPCLPLRLKKQEQSFFEEGGKKGDQQDLLAAEDVEQLLSSPNLPSDVSKYAYTRRQPHTSEDVQQSDERNSSMKQDPPFSASTSPNAPIHHARDDSIPFGHSALSRSSSSALSASASIISQDQQTPTFSKYALAAFEDVARKEIASSVSPPTPPRSSSLPGSAEVAHENKAAIVPQLLQKLPFHAVLLKPIQPLAEEVSDAEKLINLDVGGSQVFTTTVAAINTSPESHLARFVTTKIVAAQEDTHKNSKIVDTKTQAIAGSASSQAISSAEMQPQLSKDYPSASQVILHHPASPVYALHSARASVFNDVPSDEGEEAGEYDGDDEPLASYADIKNFKSKLLQVPPPSSSKKDSVRFTKMIRSASGATSASSEYESTEADEDEGELLNFLDTTPDREINDPFHLHQPASPLPESTSTIEQSARQAGDTKVASSRKATRNESPVSQTSLVFPSSSSPHSSTFRNASPIRFTDVSEHLHGRGAFEHIIAQHGKTLITPINIYLDRSPAAYESILYFLRTGQIPHKLRLHENVIQAGPSHSTLKSVIDSLPNEARMKILPIIFHPIIAELMELREEGDYLGLSELVKMCEGELGRLQEAIQGAREAAVHPAAAFPPQVLGRLKADRPRPRMVGHRQFNSESKVVPRMAQDRIQQENNWI